MASPGLRNRFRVSREEMFSAVLLVCLIGMAESEGAREMNGKKMCVTGSACQ